MPDTRGLLPKKYWNEENAEEYNNSSSIKKIQKNMTERCIQFIGSKGGKVLDIGCGGGFSLKVLDKKGFDIIGLDISKPMLKTASNRGFNRLIRGDFKNIPLKDSSFDAIISISTLQWIQATNLEEIRSEYKRAAEEIFRILKKGGTAAIQFYPETEGELEEAAEAFRKVGFKGEIVIDEEESPKKADKKYLVLEK